MKFIYKRSVARLAGGLQETRGVWTRRLKGITSASGTVQGSAAALVGQTY